MCRDINRSAKLKQHHDVRLGFQSLQGHCAWFRQSVLADALEDTTLQPPSHALDADGQAVAAALESSPPLPSAAQTQLLEALMQLPHTNFTFDFSESLLSCLLASASELSPRQAALALNALRMQQHNFYHADLTATYVDLVTTAAAAQLCGGADRAATAPLRTCDVAEALDAIHGLGCPSLLRHADVQNLARVVLVNAGAPAASLLAAAAAGYEEDLPTDDHDEEAVAEPPRGVPERRKSVGELLSDPSVVSATGGWGGSAPTATARAAKVEAPQTDVSALRLLPWEELHPLCKFFDATRNPHPPQLTALMIARIEKHVPTAPAQHLFRCLFYLAVPAAARSCPTALELCLLRILEMLRDASTDAFGAQASVPADEQADGAAATGQGLALIAALLGAAFSVLRAAGRIESMPEAQAAILERTKRTAALVLSASASRVTLHAGACKCGMKGAARLALHSPCHVKGIGTLTAVELARVLTAFRLNLGKPSPEVVSLRQTLVVLLANQLRDAAAMQAVPPEQRQRFGGLVVQLEDRWDAVASVPVDGRRRRGVVLPRDDVDASGAAKPSTGGEWKPLTQSTLREWVSWQVEQTRDVPEPRRPFIVRTDAGDEVYVLPGFEPAVSRARRWATELRRS